MSFAQRRRNRCRPLPTYLKLIRLMTLLLAASSEVVADLSLDKEVLQGTVRRKL